MDDPEVITYHEAYVREQWIGRLWFLAWTATALAVPIVTQGARRVIWLVLVILWLLMLFRHYSPDAIRHRAFMRSNSEKPL